MTATADPLAGLALPPGDPGALTAAAGVYSAAGGALSAASGQQTAAVSGVVGSAWLGHGAMRCSDAVVQCSSITRSVGDAADAATVALRTCAWGWQEAQAMWRQAQSLALAGMAATVVNNPVAAFTDQAATLGADGFESPARAQAVAMGRQAIDLFNQATTRALGALSAADGMLAGVPTTGGGGGGMELLADRSPVLSHYRRQVELLNPGGALHQKPPFRLSFLCRLTDLGAAWRRSHGLGSWCTGSSHPSRQSGACTPGPTLLRSGRNTERFIPWSIDPNDLLGTSTGCGVVGPNFSYYSALS